MPECNNYNNGQKKMYHYPVVIKGGLAAYLDGIVKINLPPLPAFNK